MSRFFGFLIDTPLVSGLIGLLLIAASLYVSPFDFDLGDVPRDPVPVDAIPDIGENQQIIFTRWPGRSPRDVEDQVTYPLTVALLGLPGVKTIRSYSFFGYSSVYVVFDDDTDFYWSRSRALEKLASLPPGTLPPNVKPELGPDATALGQVFWYTLEGEGFDLQELRALQDFQVRYALQSVEGVSEVASIGGFEKEYQIDVDPDAMRARGVTLTQVADAVRRSNIDVGARTLEINRVEYVVRGVGFLTGLEDLRQVVVAEREGVPVRLDHIARVTTGPAERRGVLDKAGAEAVGGVVVVRYGENPLQVIERVHAKIAEISPGLPKRTLEDGRVSQVKVVPFYDRTTLIHETLDTLRTALTDEVLITIVVVVVMLFELRTSLLISALLPVAVLMCFLAMKITGVDANVMSLAGIAIAIGTMVDMGIIVSENIVRRLGLEPDAPVRRVVREATVEVAGAVTTAVATTVVSFLPVFTMSGAEARLFGPLAFTKTYALLAAIFVALLLLPPLAAMVFRGQGPSRVVRRLITGFVAALGIPALMAGWGVVAALLFVWAGWRLARARLTEAQRRAVILVANVLVVAVVLWVLAGHWAPLGPAAGTLTNLLFVAGITLGVLLSFHVFIRYFGPLLRWCLDHKLLFATLPTALVLWGLMVWQGVGGVTALLPDGLRLSRPVVWLTHAFPGLGEEFMPPLDEGSFLLMPTTMPHASVGEATEVLQLQDRAIRNIPEVQAVVGKIGRVDSALDPAPVSMVETVITYVPEYGPPDPQTGERVRQWRDHIRSPDDIWAEIVAAAEVPGTTSAPKLQPIAARIVMLQSGMRAPMGVKVRGRSLEEIDALGQRIEALLKQVPGVEPAAVLADRVVGKPYLELHVDRARIARYGINVTDVQDVVEVAIGGKPLTTSVEGRERYTVRVRYPRELRDSVQALREIRVPAGPGREVPLGQLVDVEFTRGPMVIKSEDTALVGYVLFDKKAGEAEVDVVERARAHLDAKVADGTLELPVGASYTFAGNYENQERARKTLRVVLPISLLLIFLLLYLQFRQIGTSLLVFTGVAVAWSGGFAMLWLCGLDGFPPAGLGEVFPLGPTNLSVAVWVGFIALFGIATDDGVVMSTYLKQTFEQESPTDVAGIRDATVQAAMRRIRPCLMTTATTLLALLPVVSSTGRGADVMIPMALPSLGGMTFELLTLFVVPVGYCALQEAKLKARAALNLPPADGAVSS